MAAVIETPRLSLREMTRADLDFVAEMLADPDVMRYYPQSYNRAEAAHWIERNRERYAAHGFGRWLVETRGDGRPVGQVGLIYHDVEGTEELEVAYMIHHPFWRRGYASEAASACRDFAFESGVTGRLISLVRPENEPSRGVAIKMGMTSNGRLVPHANLPHLVYSISRADP